MKHAVAASSPVAIASCQVHCEIGVVGHPPFVGDSRQSNCLKVAYRCARRDGLRSGNDRVGVDAIMTIEIGNGAGLAKMLDAEWPHTMAVDPPSQASVAG